MSGNDRPQYAVIHYRVLRQLKINPTDYLLLEMVYHLSAKHGYCYKSRASMSRDIGMSFNGIKRAIDRLVDRELLVVYANGWQCGEAYLDIVNTDKGVDTTEIAQSSLKLHKVQSIAQSSDKNNSYNNNNTASKKPRVSKKQNIKQVKEDDEVAQLYYQAIKQYQLPTRNNTTIRAKITSLKREIGDDKAIKYLQFICKHYQALEMDYKPAIVEAIDIYAKRTQIREALERHYKSTNQYA